MPWHLTDDTVCHPSVKQSLESARFTFDRTIGILKGCRMCLYLAGDKLLQIPENVRRKSDVLVISK